MRKKKKINNTLGHTAETSKIIKVKKKKHKVYYLVILYIREEVNK